MLYIFLVREHLKDLTKQYDKSENDLKALQSVGQVLSFFLFFNKNTTINNSSLFLFYFMSFQFCRLLGKY